MYFLSSLFKGLCFSALLVLTYLLLIELPPASHPWPWWDKVQHVVAFGGLTVLSLLAFPNRAVAIVIVTGIYGAVMEVLQGLLTATRQPGLVDWLADMLGVALAVIVMLVFNQWWNKKT